MNFQIAHAFYTYLLEHMDQEMKDIANFIYSSIPSVIGENKSIMEKYYVDIIDCFLNDNPGLRDIYGARVIGLLEMNHFDDLNEVVDGQNEDAVDQNEDAFNWMELEFPLRNAPRPSSSNSVGQPYEQVSGLVAVLQPITFQQLTLTVPEPELPAEELPDNNMLDIEEGNYDIDNDKV